MSTAFIDRNPQDRRSEPRFETPSDRDPSLWPDYAMEFQIQRLSPELLASGKGRRASPVPVPATGPSLARAQA